jgi:cell division protein FtsI/penicillin-binding protein 2
MESPKVEKANYDGEIFKVLKELVQDKDGTIIVMDPQSGRILALVNEKYAKEALPTGFTFTLITSFASLEEGVTDFKRTIECKGSLELEGLKIRCQQEHGKLTILEGINERCLIHFCTLAKQLGLDRLKKYAEMFGLDLPEVGNIKIGIGEGILVTPIQLLRVVSAIANNGILYKPKQTGGERFVPEIQSTLPYSPLLYINLREALGNFIEEDEEIGGICCPIPEGIGSWFIGFAPPLSPRYSIVVMLKDTNEEDSLAIAQEVLKFCLKR